MGYIYDSVKVALIGNNTESATAVIKGWSPNMYRCIMIGLDYIFVTYHGGRVRKVDLDRGKVLDDLEKYSRGQSRGSIHNLLSSRQMSCLEEFYVDYNIAKVRYLIDLNVFVEKLKSSVSRLRYYGYFDGNMNGAMLERLYKNTDVLYSLAKDKNRMFKLDYVETGVKDWYRNYNLRPQYYTMDRDNGDLAIYFRKVEKIISNKIGEVEKLNNERILSGYIKSGLSVDMENIAYMQGIYKLKKYIDNPVADVYAPVGKLINRHMTELIRSNTRVVAGFTPETVKKYLGEYDEKRVNYMIKAYENFKVFDKNDETPIVDVYAVKAKTGFFDLENFYARICESLARDLISAGGYDYQRLKYNALRDEKIIPYGEFRNLMLQGRPDPVDPSIRGYAEVFSNMMCVDILVRE